MWTPPPEQRKIFFIAGGGLLLILVTWLIMGSSGDPEPDPDIALITKLSQGDNLEVIENEAKTNPKPAVKRQLYQRTAARQGPRARPMIDRGLTSPDVSVRAGAYAAMPMVAPVKDYVSVKAGLKDLEPEVRRAACAALAEMKAWGSLHDLLKLMGDDSDRSVRKAAVDAFEKIAYITATGYKADDLPGQRATAIRNLRIFVDEPGRKEVYEKWLREKGFDKVEQS